MERFAPSWSLIRKLAPCWDQPVGLTPEARNIYHRAASIWKLQKRRCCLLRWAVDGFGLCWDVTFRLRWFFSCCTLSQWALVVCTETLWDGPILCVHPYNARRVATARFLADGTLRVDLCPSFHVLGSTEYPTFRTGAANPRIHPIIDHWPGSPSRKCSKELMMNSTSGSLTGCPSGGKTRRFYS